MFETRQERLASAPCRGEFQTSSDLLQQQSRPTLRSLPPCHMLSNDALETVSRALRLTRAIAGIGHQRRSLRTAEGAEDLRARELRARPEKKKQCCSTLLLRFLPANLTFLTRCSGIGGYSSLIIAHLTSDRGLREKFAPFATGPFSHNDLKITERFVSGSIRKYTVPKGTGYILRIHKVPWYPWYQYPGPLVPGTW